MPISLDPTEYPDPKRFYPERFLNEDLDKPLAGHWSFGMGRRGSPFPLLSVLKLTIVCVGYVLAMRNLWIATSRILYCFDVKYGGVTFLERVY
jgi:cytochrome P450